MSGTGELDDRQMLDVGQMLTKSIGTAETCQLRLDPKTWTLTEHTCSPGIPRVSPDVPRRPQMSPDVPQVSPGVPQACVQHLLQQ